MEKNWKIVNSFGDIDTVARLAKEAILMASVTGSKGASVKETSFKNNQIAVTAMVEVEKVGA